MKRVLFVSNGHGEVAIAARIAQELAAIGGGAVALDHLALVGDVAHGVPMCEVGPRRAMPSGGLIAMGNLRNAVRDVRAGLIGLTLAQRRFLRAARGTYAAVVAVGDVYALLMALLVRAPAVFVGTAKSVHVAPYGPFERRLLARARAVFVRDEPTAARLRAQGVAAEAPGNVIVDLYATADDPLANEAFRDFAPVLALFPGSRERAYAEARSLLAVLRAMLPSHPRLGGALSIAPGIDAKRMARALEDDGWTIAPTEEQRVPFAVHASDGRVVARAWHGPIGPLLARCAAVVGQAGTANEAAAAAGVPVIALAFGARALTWYRKRQRGLLGDALAIVPGDPSQAAEAIGALLDDARMRAHMGAVGRARMGPRGGALAIARRVAALAGAPS